LILLVLSIACGASADDSVNVASTPTHREFVDSCRIDLATHLIGKFTPNRTRPIVIVPDTVNDSSRILAGSLSRILSDRGLLVRDSSPDHAEAGNWMLRYDLTPGELTLTEPQRRAFLGKVWVKRSFDAALSIAVYDDLDGMVVWSDRADSTYHDWIMKSDLKRLESNGLAPRASRSSWEKAQLPLMVGGGALIVGLVMLSLN
jgi:hypothetical protein